MDNVENRGRKRIGWKGSRLERNQKSEVREVRGQAEPKPREVSPEKSEVREVREVRSQAEPKPRAGQAARVQVT